MPALWILIKVEPVSFLVVQAPGFLKVPGIASGVED
jgi:hypothetical protein